MKNRDDEQQLNPIISMSDPVEVYKEKNNFTPIEPFITSGPTEINFYKDKMSSEAWELLLDLLQIITSEPIICVDVSATAVCLTVDQEEEI